MHTHRYTFPKSLSELDLGRIPYDAAWKRTEIFTITEP